MRATSTTTVLLVEPHADSGDMYAEFLRHAGFVVRNVSNAIDALAAAWNADLVVTNISLPGRMNGLELIAQLRRDEPTRHTPIIALSAGILWIDQERSQQAGCDLFLQKPCLPDTLMHEIRRLARRGKFSHVRSRPAKGRRMSSLGAAANVKRPA